MPKNPGKGRWAGPGAVRAAREAVPADLSADRLAALLAVSGALATSVDLPSVLQTAVDTLEASTEAAISALDARIDPLEALPARHPKRAGAAPAAP